MKATLRKMRDRLDLVSDSLEPVKPTCVGTLRPGGLIEFEGRLWKNYAAIHEFFPGRFDLYYEGVTLTIQDPCDPDGCLPVEWNPGERERLEVMP